MPQVPADPRANTVKDLSFGNWVKRRRKALDLTQQELAQRVGCSVSLIFKVESDERRPSRQVAQLLAEHLEVPFEQRPLFLKVARQERGIEGLDLLSAPSTTPPFASVQTQSLPASVSNPPRTNLPLPLTSLVGRENELHVIAQQIQELGCRLLTLTGPGGVGKTRLALQVAHQLQDRFKSGVYFISLVGTSSSNFIIPAIASSLGVSLSGTNDIRGQLFNFLKDKNLVLVLDNLEHLLTGIEILTELLENAPHVKILATSRERLGLRSEWAFAVQGLPVPSKIELNHLESNSAVALFWQRSKQAKFDFQLSSADLPWLRRICELVEGLPLGLELAATWVRTLSCREIAQEIERTIDFLAASARDVDERHRSIRAIFDYSWNLLSGDERRVMRRLSLFRGGFTRDSAEKVSGASLQLLSSFVDKSLIRPNGSGRYELHELIRQYAREQLIQSNEFQQTCEQHLQFFVGLVNETEPKLRSADQIFWLNRLEQDHDNLREALEYSLKQEGSIEHTKSSLQLAGGLYLLWKRRNHWREGRDWLQRALAQSKGFPVTIERATALNAAALLAAEQTDTQPAYQLAAENLRLSQELGNTYNIACAFNTLGMVLWKQKKFAEAQACCENGLALFRELGDQFAVADSLHTLAHISINKNDPDLARTYLEEGLSISKEMDHAIGLAEVLGDLGLVAYLQNDYGTAQSYIQESLIRFRETGLLPGIESALNRLGDLARCRGDYAEAGRLYEESLVLCQEFDDRDETASLLHNLGYVTLHRGEHRKAMGFFKNGLVSQYEMGNEAGIAECLTGIASVLASQGRSTEGVHLFGVAEALREAAGAVLWPANQIEYDRSLAGLRTSLDEQTITALWLEGRAIPLAQAVGLATNE